jgi:hypothetical protein
MTICQCPMSLRHLNYQRAGPTDMLLAACNDVLTPSSSLLQQTDPRIALHSLLQADLRLRACAGVRDLLSCMCKSTKVDRQLDGFGCSLHREDIDAVTCSSRHTRLQSARGTACAASDCRDISSPLPLRLAARPYCGNITFNRVSTDVTATSWPLCTCSSCAKHA